MRLSLVVYALRVAITSPSRRLTAVTARENPEQASELLPILRQPILVAAFEGWNDAAEAATAAIEHLELIWDSQPLVELDSEDYYDYQVNRPTVKQIDGVTREISWPATRLSVCSPPGAQSDIVVLRGIEPNMRWRSFCAEILELIEELHVTSVVILGSLLADTPHTRPVPVTGTAYSAESAERFNLEQNRYEGPTGITGVLQDECVRAGIPAISFWAAVPHYVSQPPNPKATLALLQRVEDVLDIEVPLSELPQQAEDWEQAVTEMTADDEEIADYVRTLEERGDAEVDMSDAVNKIDGDAIAAEFERYLRRRGPGSFGL
ncbi:MAG: PAC2 family protein [Mycobacteriaceae bacterium]